MLRNTAMSLLLICGASTAQAADNAYHEIDSSLFVCESQAQAMKLAFVALDEEKMRDFVFADNSGCAIWKTPATYRVVPGTASKGIVQIQIDKDNRVGTDPGMGWLTQRQLFSSNGTGTNLVRLDRPFLACTTLEGAKQNIPTSMRAEKAGIVVLGATDGTKTRPAQNYSCSRVEPVTYAIGFLDSADSGYARYRLMDAKNSEVWMLKFWK
jgi:hypothetical protein